LKFITLGEYRLHCNQIQYYFPKQIIVTDDEDEDDLMDDFNKPTPHVESYVYIYFRSSSLPLQILAKDGNDAKEICKTLDNLLSNEYNKISKLKEK